MKFHMAVYTLALVFFKAIFSGEGYEWSASCAPDNNGLTSVEMTTDGGICTVRLLNVSQYDGVTLSATVTNGAESRSICLATDIRVGEKMCIRDSCMILRRRSSSSAGMESISVRIIAQASSTRSMALSGRKRSVI